MKWLLLVLCVLCSFLFLYNLQSRDFWAPDEGDFAEIAREMHHDPVVPHLNNKPYGEKPPLFYYMTYGSHLAFPSLRDEVSMRLPSALLAFAFAVFFLVSTGRFSGRRDAILSTAILISSPLFFWQARYLQVDMAFAVFTAGSLLSFFRFSRQGSSLFYYLFFVCTGLAFMTKGPLSVALIFPTVLIYLGVERDFSLLKKKETYVGIFVLAAIVVPWYLAVYWREGLPYLYENIIRQNLMRFFDAWSHKRPFYYYFTTLPLDFFPWSLFLPMGVYVAFTRMKGNPLTRFSLIWCGWMFFFLSLSTGKISKYMLPLLPALSLIAAPVFLEGRSRYRTVAFTFLSVLFLGLGGALLFFRTGLYPQFYPERVFLGVLSMAFALTLGFFVKKERPLHAFAALFIFMALSYGAANVSVFGKWNPYKSPKPAAERIRPYLRDGTPWIYYGSMRGIYVYYVGTYATHVDEHDAEALRALGGKGKAFFILTRKRDMNEVATALPGVRPVFEERIGDTIMVFAKYSGG
jgi:4-amino-4-deoxy-L-arabinose transferase-like glycosyltransferase